MTGVTAPEEMIDVYDWSGRWTGVTKPKSLVHQDGDIHIAVHGVITDGRERVIAQFRGPNVKLMRNVWDAMSVAGHISALTAEEREDPNNWDLITQAWNALVREFQEEIGVDLSSHTPFSGDVVMFGATRTDQTTEDGWWDRTISFNFMVRMPGLDISAFQLEEGKVLDVQWVPVAEIENAAATSGDLGDDKRFALRMPDNHQLMQGAADCARRMQLVDDSERDTIPRA